MWLGLCGLCAAVLSLAGIFLYLDPQIPTSESYRNVRLETPLRVMSRDNRLLAEYGERRVIPIRLDEVPDAFVSALLDTEDKRFYDHQGIDFISLANDLVNLVGTMITQGELGPGASTITMQLARNVSFSLERRFLRKFKEMLLALKIEQELSKDEILELYMNVVAFGKRAYGAQAAAYTYYGKPLNQLRLAQLAMLAGIPQAPSAANPINGPERAIARRNLVLSRMLAQGSISQAEFDQARAEPISANVFARDIDVPSPYAAEWVRQQGVALLDDLYTGGYEIVTTIDGKMQAAAIEALRTGLQNYDRRHGYRGAEASWLADHTDLFEALAPAAQQRLQALQTHAAELNESLEVAAAKAAEAAPNQSALDTTALSEPSADNPQSQLHGLLADIAVYGDLQPAVVLAVNDTAAVVQDQSGQWHTLLLEDTSWARPYIEVDLRGPPLTSMQEIVAPGDLVRLRLDDGELLLSQLPEIQGAVVALDPNNGAVRSLVGGFDFFRNQYNHALQAARQPGSGFKPFVYSAAIDNGVTPASVFMDAPLVFEDDDSYSASCAAFQRRDVPSCHGGSCEELAVLHIFRDHRRRHSR